MNTRLLRLIPRTSVVALVALVAALLAGLQGASAAYPGANGKIAFQSGSAGNFDIWSMDADGGGLTNLTNDPSGDDFDPIWSPDGATIAFVKNSEGHTNIWVMNADGSGQTNLTPGPAGSAPPRFHCRPGPNGQFGVAPTWSPTGSEIAYSVSGDIFVMQANGAGKTNITCSYNGQFSEAEPAWSPDGSTIAYRYFSADVANDIWAMNSDGTNRRALTSTPQRESFPDWSPDGTEIVYMGHAGSIWKMNADGSGQTLLVGGARRGCGVHPTWAPDATKIVFSSNCYDAGNGYDIFVMDPDGTGVTRLPSSAATESFPSWQPVASALPTLTIRNASVVEGDAGTVGASFVVRLSERSVQAVTVDYETRDGSAKEPRDYRSASGRLTFAPGERRKTISVDVVGDTLVEQTESFSLVLTGATNATIADDDAIGRIRDDDSSSEPPRDTVPPTLVVPADFMVDATGPSGALVSYEATASDDVDPAPALSCAPASGSVFPLGPTKVTCTATDAAGNTATRAFFVDVVDTTPPVLGLEKLTTRVYQAWDFFGTTFVQAVFFPGAPYPVSASDLVDPAPVVACDPPPNARLPVGSTMLRCTATDFSGNTSFGEVELVVRGPVEALGGLIDRLLGYRLGDHMQRKLLTPLERARNAFAKGAMVDAEKDLEQFELELDKQSKKGLSSEAAAKLGADIRSLRGNLFPSQLTAIAERVRRLHAAVLALGQSWFDYLGSKIGSVSERLDAGDRMGALKDLRDAKAALASVRDKLTLEDAADLERDLDAAIASLTGGGPKGGKG